MAKNGIRKHEHKMALRIVEQGDAPNKAEALAMIRSGYGAHNLQHRRTDHNFYPKDPPAKLRNRLNLVKVRPSKERKRRRK